MYMVVVSTPSNGSCCCCRAASRCNNSGLQQMALSSPHMPCRGFQLDLTSRFALGLLFAVADRARMLRTCTQGKLNLELCLFIFTEQPQLLSVNTKQMAARIMTLADALGLPPADVAEVLIRCPALLDVLPLRCVALFTLKKRQQFMSMHACQLLHYVVMLRQGRAFLALYPSPKARVCCSSQS